jgi:hypothetical protein
VQGQGPLERRLQNREALKQANNQVKRLVVITKHMEHNRTFSLNGLTQLPAREQTFDYQGNQISVERYFEQQYTIRLGVSSRLPVCLPRYSHVFFEVTFDLTLVRYREEAKT